MVTHVQARPLANRPGAPAFQAWLTCIGRAVWRVLERVGARRARWELMRLAAANEITNPELAAHLRSVVREDGRARG